MNTQDGSEAHLPQAQARNCSFGEPVPDYNSQMPSVYGRRACSTAQIPDAILHAPGTCLLPGRATSYLLDPVWGGAEKVVEFREHYELG